MADFLLELLSEEIPARMQAKARNDLARMFAEELEGAGLTTEGIETFATPRRLALIARGLALETTAVSEELKGPRTSAPDQAIEGFLKKTGLKREALIERDGVYIAQIDRPGRATSAVLAEAIERIVGAFPWPKSMRWGAASSSTSSLRWVRPLQGIVALLGEQIVPVEIDGIAAGAATLGHRFHHPGTITIGGAHDYVEKLRACHVIVDPEEREALVRDGAREAAAAAGLTLVEDEGLVVENAGLTEWPVPLLGRFEADFLDVPREVIVLTMRTNQKYFACAEKDGALAPAFVCVANIDAKDGGEGIIEGNRRVLAARLADARFFWEQDLKVPLEEQAKKLGGIVFHEKLGTVADKVERVAKLARWMVEEGVVKGAKPDVVERAARLAKADLVSGMVGEFPELQGVIGGYLAAAQGETPEVAAAIRDHYKPVGQGDEVPTAPVTVAVALADKLDTLSAFFAIDEKPTGSKDPFALRRAALGVLSLLRESDVRMPVAQTVIEAVHRLPIDVHRGKPSDESDIELIASFGSTIGSEPRAIAGLLLSRDIMVFVIKRLAITLRSSGNRGDFVDAAFRAGSNDFLSLIARAEALQQFIGTDEGRDLHIAYKRAANILKREKWSEGEASENDRADEERRLEEAVSGVAPTVSATIEAEDFRGTMTALAALRAPIDLFFDKVTVNDPNAGVRARRLNLLARFRDAVHRVADFSKIEG